MKTQLEREIRDMRTQPNYGHSEATPQAQLPCEASAPRRQLSSEGTARWFSNLRLSQGPLTKAPLSITAGVPKPGPRPEEIWKYSYGVRSSWHTVPGRGQNPSQTAPAEAYKYRLPLAPSAVCYGQGDKPIPLPAQQDSQPIRSDKEDQVRKRKLKPRRKEQLFCSASSIAKQWGCFILFPLVTLG